MKACDDSYAVDANIILRYLLRDDVGLYQKSLKIMQSLFSGQVSMFCDPVTLSEIVFVLFRVYKLSPQDIWNGLEPIIKADAFVLPDKDRYIRAFELYVGPVPHFGDACVCAAALEKSEGRLLSFDRGVSGVHGVTRLEEVTASGSGG